MNKHGLAPVLREKQAAVRLEIPLKVLIPKVLQWNWRGNAVLEHPEEDEDADDEDEEGKRLEKKSEKAKKVTGWKEVGEGPMELVIVLDGSELCGPYLPALCSISSDNMLSLSPRYIPYCLSSLSSLSLF